MQEVKQECSRQLQPNLEGALWAVNYASELALTKGAWAFILLHLLVIGKRLWEGRWM